MSHVGITNCWVLLVLPIVGTPQTYPNLVSQHVLLLPIWLPVNPQIRPGGSCQSPLLTAKFATFLDGESLKWTTRLQEDESRGREFLSKTGSSFESSWLRWMLARILWMDIPDIPDIPFLGYSYQVLTNGLEGILSWELCFLLILINKHDWCKHEANMKLSSPGSERVQGLFVGAQPQQSRHQHPRGDLCCGPIVVPDVVILGFKRWA